MKPRKQQEQEKHYPILQVAVYDSVGNMNKVIELP
jgi:hypothetical protein